MAAIRAGELLKHLTKQETINNCSNFSVHQCLFCTRTFDNAAEKDDHTLEHFAQETCTECDQKLIRIGAKLYTLHDTVTCIRRKFKTEHHFESCFVENPSEANDPTEAIHSSAPTVNIVDEIELKMEVETERQTKVPQNQFDASNESGTNQTSEVSATIQKAEEAIDGQSADESFTRDDNGWLDFDSSMDSICRGESSANIELDPAQHNFNDIFDGDLMSKRCLTSNERLSINEDKAISTIKTQPNEAKSTETPQKQSKQCKLFLQNGEDLKVCEICSSSFSTAEELSEHTAKCFLKNEDGSIECKSLGCNKILASWRTLKQHKLLRHTPPGTHVCRRCAKVFETEAKLSKHRPECISKWKNRFGIKNSTVANAKFECYLDKTNCKSISSLLSHMRWKHTMNNVKYRCEICGLGFFAKSLQEMHVRKVHEPMKDEKLMCNICGKFLTKGYTLKNHMKIHSGDKPFECTYDGCSKSFPTKTARYIHLRSHNPDERLKCPHEGCSKSFISKPSLTIHLRSHSGERPFKCPHEGCNKSFVTKNVIASHMLIHSGEKPFKCAHYGCRKEFRTKGARDRHMGTKAHK